MLVEIQRLESRSTTVFIATFDQPALKILLAKVVAVIFFVRQVRRWCGRASNICSNASSYGASGYRQPKVQTFVESDKIGKIT